ncbi:MAG: histidine phosphatase family protein [Bdellovibrionales bacterium]
MWRTIILIRHGQYEKKPERLTALGRKQANLVAKAVKPNVPAQLFSSTMPRATETAAILSDHLKLKPQKKSFLCEALLPGPPSFTNQWLRNIPSKSEKANFKKSLKVNAKRADQAFHFLFRKPRFGQETMAVVAHGNVIRYWVCKALKVKSETWLKMDIVHASITALRINAKGELILLRFSDCGHLPLEMRTYT